MRKLAVVHAALIAAVAVALGAASGASGALSTITGGSCTTGTTTFNADFSYGPANAFNPLFVRNTDAGVRRHRHPRANNSLAVGVPVGQIALPAPNRALEGRAYPPVRQMPVIG